MNYQSIYLAIIDNKPFTHNKTLTGEIKKYNSQENIYRIYSYETLIFEENLTTGLQWFNPKIYSRTTSNQQKLIQRAKSL